MSAVPLITDFYEQTLAGFIISFSIYPWREIFPSILSFNSLICSRVLTLLGTGEETMKELWWWFVFEEKKHENSGNPKFRVWVEMYVRQCWPRGRGKHVSYREEASVWILAFHMFPTGFSFFFSVQGTELREFHTFFFTSYGHPIGKQKPFFLSLIFQMRKRDSERLNKVPKVTQLMNGRPRNQIQAYLFITAHSFFSNRLYLRYRLLKAENVCFSCLIFNQALNKLYRHDIFIMIYIMMIFFLCF